MSGSVERINIRATTITNADNQSMIVPNRAFVTGHLVNWTLKDKVLRLSVELKVAPGADPDRVSDLLLSIARDDADVLRNPVPSAFMEEFGETSHRFLLHVHVPDPSLSGRVRHRLFAQIQQRFKEAGIAARPDAGQSARQAPRRRTPRGARGSGRQAEGPPPLSHPAASPEAILLTHPRSGRELPPRHR